MNDWMIFLAASVVLVLLGCVVLYFNGARKK